jgi:hypothetical protein
MDETEAIHTLRKLTACSTGARKKRVFAQKQVYSSQESILLNYGHLILDDQIFGMSRGIAETDQTMTSIRSNLRICS